MKKNVAVIAVNPVNGSGLFQYLEAFYENGISYKLFAVAETQEIVTNSGIALRADEVIASLKEKEDEFDALVFACGDAMPVFSEHASAPYNRDMMEVIAGFGQKGKILIGHCVGGMLFDFAGAADGKRVAVHPLAKPALQRAVPTDNGYETDGNIYTAQTENTISQMIDKVIEVLN